MSWVLSVDGRRWLNCLLMMSWWLIKLVNNHNLIILIKMSQVVVFQYVWKYSSVCYILLQIWHGMFFLNKYWDRGKCRSSYYDLDHFRWRSSKEIIHNLPTKQLLIRWHLSRKTIIEPAIIKSLTMVISQVLNMGIFSDKLKIAK